MRETMEQSEFFDYILTFAPQDYTLFLARNISSSRPAPTAWIPLNEWDWSCRADFRSVLDNELIFDIDEHDWHTAVSVLNALTSRLKFMDIPFTQYLSGGHAFHVQILLDCSGIEQVCGWQQLRNELFKFLTDGIDGRFDPSVVDWDERRLVRAEGGKKFTFKVPFLTVPAQRPKFNAPFFRNGIQAWNVPWDIISQLTLVNENITNDCPECPNLPLKGLDWPGCVVCKGSMAQISLEPENRPKGIRPCVQNIIDTEQHGFESNLVVGCELIGLGWTDDRVHEVIAQIEPKYKPEVTQRYINYIKQRGYSRWSCKKLNEKGFRTEVCPCNPGV